MASTGMGAPLARCNEASSKTEALMLDMLAFDCLDA
jgi:hypothetical protein